MNTFADPCKNLFSHLVWSYSVRSVFFGGGTPSLAHPSTITKILETVSKQVNLSDEAEITLEVNPTPAGMSKLKDYHHAGVNRFSIGVQVIITGEIFKWQKIMCSHCLWDHAVIPTVFAGWGPEKLGTRSQLPGGFADSGGGQDVVSRWGVCGYHVRTT